MEVLICLYGNWELIGEILRTAYTKYSCSNSYSATFDVAVAELVIFVMCSCLKLDIQGKLPRFSF